ncbi:M56 family metallopeptidase [Gemmatimonas sp.]|uniref:M56 family metallopeptidase n=2 Tax=Gemmatimonas sp. TaxID=1962908 RepID=UPI003563A331
MYVSHDVGPALVGLLRHSIVLPEWALRLPAADRALILEHEREQARARDPVAVAGAAMLVLLFPWNPLVWLMFGQLRLAVEVDCDARVLARTKDVRAYGSLLLTVGERSLPGATPVMGLAEAASHLERRLQQMTRPRPTNRSLRILATGLLTVVLLGAAWNVPRPASGGPSAVALRQANVLEYRWIENTPSTTAAATRYTDPVTGQTLVLTDSVMLDLTGIDSAWVASGFDDSVRGVAVSLTASAAARVGAQTATHIGRRIAVVIDGRVGLVATVNTALGRVLPAAEGSPAVADSLARQINQLSKALRPR